MSEFKISIERTGNRIDIALSGDFDEHCSRMVKELLRNNCRGVHVVSIDVNGLTNWNKHEFLESHVGEWEKALSLFYEN